MVTICVIITKDKSNEQARLDGSTKKKKGSYLSGEERLKKDADGNIFQLDVYDTDWYYWYILNPDLEGKSFQRKFQRRF